MKKYFIMITAVLTLFLFCSCSAPRISETGRTAVEQFLISTVIESGISHADFTPYKDKKLFIEYDYLAPQVDKPYIQGYFEMHLAEQGVIVSRDAKDADYLVQILCGVLATDTNKLTLGTPMLPIPIPDTSLNVAIPEVPLLQKLTRTGYSRFAFNILEAKTRKPIQVIKGIETSTQHTNWTFLLIPFKSHDMPLKIRSGAETSFDLDY